MLTIWSEKNLIILSTMILITNNMDIFMQFSYGPMFLFAIKNRPYLRKDAKPIISVLILVVKNN